MMQKARMGGTTLDGKSDARLSTECIKDKLGKMPTFANYLYQIRQQLNIILVCCNEATL